MPPPPPPPPRIQALKFANFHFPAAQHFFKMLQFKVLKLQFQKNLNVDEGNDVEEGEEEEGAEGDENQDCNMDNEKEGLFLSPLST